MAAGASNSTKAHPFDGFFVSEGVLGVNRRTVGVSPARSSGLAWAPRSKRTTLSGKVTCNLSLIDLIW